MPTVERKFTRHLDSLAKVFEFIDRFVEQEKIDDDAKRAVYLAVDELFTNTVKYHPTNPNDISIQLRADGETMILELVDHDVEPFDLTRKPDPDLAASLDERKPGGLGIFLTKKVVDDIHYRHHDKRSIITLKKSFRRKNV